jgi:hypothetical protein
MALKNGIPKTPAFSSRSLLVVFVVVLAVTGGNLWINRGGPPVGYARFEGYGFSIDYRREMYFMESGIGGGSAFDNSGSIQGTLSADSLEQFGVIWLARKGLPSHVAPTPEGALDQVFAIIGMGDTQIPERGELRILVKDDREVVYQTFSVLDSGITIPGIIGAWYCEEAGKFLILYLIHVPDINQPEILSQELEQKWLSYLDSIKCH